MWIMPKEIKFYQKNDLSFASCLYTFLSCVKITSVGLKLDRPQLHHWLLTLAQQSAEVRALQGALSFFLSFGVCLQLVVCASLILDLLPFHPSKDFNWIDAPDKAIKQSRDLKNVFVLANFTLRHYIVLCSFLRRFAEPEGILLRNAGVCGASLWTKCVSHLSFWAIHRLMWSELMSKNL